MIYSSKQNILIKKIASLKDKKYRKEYNLYISEGIKTVNEAISFNMPIEYIVVTTSKKQEITQNSYNTIEVTDEVFAFISQEVTPQGALVVIRIEQNTIKPPIKNAVILDGIQDPGNLGTIIRSALAFGFLDIYLVNSVDAYSIKTVRSSMSAIYKVNLYKGSLEEVLNVLQGYEIIVADMKGDSLNAYEPKNKYAICVGNEGNGISKELLLKADKVVSIPMGEYSESLNVAVALSIIMYQFSK